MLKRFPQAALWRCSRLDPSDFWACNIVFSFPKQTIVEQALVELGLSFARRVPKHKL
jgi:hypothetical protein